MNAIIRTLDVAVRPQRDSVRWATPKLAGYELRDVVRSKWILVYGLFFFTVTESLLWFGAGAQSALVSLVNVLLLIVPLVAIVFGTMYLYSARPFIELLLSQPVDRKQLYVALYAGLAIPLTAAFAAGTALPFLLHGLAGEHLAAFASIIGAGALLTLVFVGFAFPIAVGCDERVRGLGVALGIWLLACLIYDGLVLLILTAAADYPLETPAIVMMVMNPVDLARTLLLLQFDLAALMGYTGAVFDRFFGGAWGTILSIVMLVGWAAAPFFLGLAQFRKKDF